MKLFIINYYRFEILIILFKIDADKLTSEGNIHANRIDVSRQYLNYFAVGVIDFDCRVLTHAFLHSPGAVTRFNAMLDI